MIKHNFPLLAALMLHLLASDACALSVPYLPPREAVGYATDIAVGVVQVSHENGLVVRFQPKQVLKGSLEADKLYNISYADDYNRINLKEVMERIAASAEGKPAVLFLGRLHTDGETLVPNSMDGAVWPRHSPYPLDALLQTPDTLEECITFVKAVMANPEIKLKNVNGRRVLPDNYIPPKSGAALKAESKAVSSPLPTNTPNAIKHPEQEMVVPQNKVPDSKASKSPFIDPQEKAKVSISWPPKAGIVFVAVIVLCFAARHYSRKLPPR